MMHYIMLYVIVVLTLIVYSKNIKNLITNLYDGSVCEPLKKNNFTYLSRRTSYATLCLSKEENHTIFQKKQYNVEDQQRNHNEVMSHVNIKIKNFNENYKLMNEMYINESKINNLCQLLYTSLKTKEEVMLYFNTHSDKVLNEVILNKVNTIVDKHKKN